MHLPRKYYRAIARDLVENPTPEAIQEAVNAINGLLEERSSLILKLLEKRETQVKSKKSKSWWESIFSKD